MTAARELFGSDWQEALRERLFKNFNVPEPVDLTGLQACSEIEEMVSLLALQRRTDPEAVRNLLCEKAR